MVQLWADFAATKPDSDAVLTGTVDGVTLSSAPFTQFKGVAQSNTCRYADKKGVVVQIDFADGWIFVVAPHISLTRLEYTDGVDVQFTINGGAGMQIGYEQIVMRSVPGNRLVYER
jgi:hypothetical protein